MDKMSEKLINTLNRENSIFIQTHDFPDPDSIAAAFGLQFFLKEKGIVAEILYEGELQTNPVERMVKDLGIVMKNVDEVALHDDVQIIIVDGCAGNENITNQRGKIVGVIDHHLGGDAEDVAFVDIRPDYGSCSTIVALYIQENDIKLIPAVATALAIGLHVDTNSLRRRTTQIDVEVFSFLYNHVDQKLFGPILRNNVFQKELIIYEQALKRVRIDQKFAFYYFPEQCSQNLLGILADFFLAIKEVEFVVLCAQSDSRIIFSIRNENSKWNAAAIIKKALKGLGAGGGHKDMAGGVIKDLSLFDEERIYNIFRKQLGI